MQSVVRNVMPYCSVYCFSIPKYQYCRTSDFSIRALSTEYFPFDSKFEILDPQILFQCSDSLV